MRRFPEVFQQRKAFDADVAGGRGRPESVITSPAGVVREPVITSPAGPVGASPSRRVRFEEEDRLKKIHQLTDDKDPELEKFARSTPVGEGCRYRMKSRPDPEDSSPYEPEKGLTGREQDLGKGRPKP